MNVDVICQCGSSEIKVRTSTKAGHTIITYAFCGGCGDFRYVTFTEVVEIKVGTFSDVDLSNSLTQEVLADLRRKAKKLKDSLKHNENQLEIPIEP